MKPFLARILLCVIAIIMPVFQGCHDTTTEKPAAVIVKTAVVALTPDVEERTYTGVILPRREVEESFRVGGKMEQRLVDVGDRVAKGQVLAILDKKDLHLALESAEAERRAALSNEKLAATNEVRYKQLLERNVVSQAEYDLKHLALEEAKGRLERADRAFQLANSQLSYAILTASIDGVVTKVSVEPGQVVAQGRAIVSLAYQGELEVQADIPESRLADLKSSDAEVSLWATDDQRYRAVLRETAPSADAATRTYAVRFSLPDADEHVRLGMTATLWLSRNRSSSLIARIPASALVNEGKGPFVWVVDPATGKVSQRAVTVERYGNQDVFVRGQIHDGDMVVAAGAHKIDGQILVRPAEPVETGNP